MFETARFMLPDNGACTEDRVVTGSSIAFVEKPIVVIERYLNDDALHSAKILPIGRELKLLI